MPSNVTRLYQAVLRDQAAPISIRLRRTFSEWLVGKGFPPADAGRAIVEHEKDGARLCMERRGDSGRYTLDEPCESGLVRTRVTYTESVPGMTGWVVITVDQHGDRDPLTANAPGFVPSYLRTARITDGGVHLEDSPVVVDEDDVQRFVHTLAEHRRRVPVVVVSIDAQDVGASRSRADYLATEVAGAGVVARLGDLRSQDRFNQAMGADLGVFGGGIRTYLAPFDPAEERYPYRHRPMAGSMIRNQGNHALDLAIDGLIGETARRKLPDDVQKTLRVVNRVLAGRAEQREIAEAVAARPAVGNPGLEELRRRMMAKTVRSTPPVVIDEESTPQSQPEQPEVAEPETAPVELAGLAQNVADIVVKELRGELEAALSLAISSTSSDASGKESGELLRQIRTLGAHVAGLRDLVTERRGNDELLVEAEDESDRLAAEMDSLRGEHSLLLEEYAEAVTSVRRLTEQVRRLERKLAEAGQPVYGVALDDDLFEPTNLMDTLIEARERLPHVVIGDTDSAATRLDLNHPALCRTWAAKAWDALRALNDFARARSSGQFAGGFYDWCTAGCSGRLTIPTGMLSMRESQSVANRPKYSDPRRFAVPTEVDPSGKLLMEAHVKLRPVGYPAPRMYFHDDSGGVTGKIWVGYLGDHLPNTRTN
ncbi:hypothetical protein [Planotetraspora kaengkrachanensis]|uniref:Uncharacterized protein n=1 Tax=Planotetraspora kaengkrachanensis TaxID=575193 RepID=A0A8J3M640_9ACTN|nr:hypothetical protein [Planotetraspora kaengkrachanensis]GIG80035.1 hypothetical protein Pka01_31620 [Planotetraspora kaengkrachanensis]